MVLIPEAKYVCLQKHAFLVETKYVSAGTFNVARNNIPEDVPRRSLKIFLEK